MVEIDGSVGEGGGQIVRMALVLGLVTATPFRLHSIRARRPTPGLKAQLLHLISGLRMITRAEIRGDTKGSTELLFVPGEIDGGLVQISSDEAISIPLLLEGLVPVALRARRASQMLLQGGTDIAHSMSFDYYRHVLAPRLGQVDVALDRRGFYPGAGGRVRLSIEPQQLRPLVAAPSALLAITVICVVCGSSLDGVAEELVRGATEVLALSGLTARTSTEHCEARSSGAVITLVAALENGQFLGADALMTLGERADETGARAAAQLIEELKSGAAVDRHAASDLVLHLAVQGGSIEVSEITRHLQGAMYVCERFLGPIFNIQHRTITVMPR
jgi:RNA 3'-phosphate cyclase